MAKQTIGIAIKLFGGIDRDSGISEYDPDQGLDLAVPEGIRLAKVLKKTGIKKDNFSDWSLTPSNTGPPL